MLEKRQKNKSTPQQLDFVESITQVDRLFTKRRLIAFALSLSILSSLFFMIYGQILKGKKMPGHFGNVSKSVLNLKIVSINVDTSEITLSGSAPGSYNSWVVISKA